MEKEKYEIIVVDDCSDNEETIELLQIYANKHQGLLTCLSLEENSGGASAPRNKGIECATGEYVFFLDSDDYLNDETISILYNYAKENNSDSVHGKYASSPDDGNRNPYSPSFFKNGNIPRIDFTKEQFFFPTVHALFKSDIIKKAKIRFDPKVKLGEDTVFRYIFYANSDVHSIIADYECYNITLHIGEHLTKSDYTIADLAYKTTAILTGVYKGTVNIEVKHRLVALTITNVMKLLNMRGGINGSTLGKLNSTKSELLAVLSDILHKYVPCEADVYFSNKVKLRLGAIRRNDSLMLEIVDNVTIEKSRSDKLAKTLGAILTLPALDVIVRSQSCEFIHNARTLDEYNALLKIYLSQILVFATVANTAFRIDDANTPLALIGLKKPFITNNSYLGIVGLGKIIEKCI
jgi:glycosyltransferase involved in cell wall biosynthesis